MNLKTKIWWGFSLLCLLSLGLAGLGAYFNFRLAADSRAVMQDNFRTLEYARDMLAAIDQFESDSAQAVILFNHNLSLEKANITEQGEGELVEQIAQSYVLFRSTPANRPQTARALREKCRKLMDMNMQPMKRKNVRAEETASLATQGMTVASALAALFLFSFLFNFPSAIINPLRELTGKIKLVSQGNYNQKIEIHRNDEIGELASAFNEMVKQLDIFRKSNLAQILFEQRRTETVLKVLSDGLVIMDENERIAYLNPAAETILGAKAAELAGKKAAEIAQTNDLFRAIWTGENATARPLAIALGSKTGYFQPEKYIVSGTDPRDAQEKIIGVALRLKDVTVYQELDEAKTNFMATISHELKTPLSSINLSLKLLSDSRIGSLNDEQQKLAQNIHGETARLLKLVGELLDISQLESGRIRLKPTAVSPLQLIQSAASAIETQAKQKGVRFEIEAPVGLPPVFADPEKTVWVLSNLLINAVRYSNENQTVIIKAAFENNRVRFTVQDFGAGIPPEQQNLLFSRYYSTQTPAAPKGTGLGLAIAKEFIEAQGGTIWAESIPKGEGATFHFNLPVIKNGDMVVLG